MSRSQGLASCKIIKRGALHAGEIQCIAEQCNAVQCSAVQRSAVQILIPGNLPIYSQAKEVLGLW